MYTYDIRVVRTTTSHVDVVRLYPVYRTYDIALTMYNRMSCVARTMSYVMHVRHHAYVRHRRWQESRCQAAASCLNPCSTRFLTLASCIRPLSCWPPSQPPPPSMHILVMDCWYSKLMLFKKKSFIDVFYHQIRNGIQGNVAGNCLIDCLISA